MWLAVRCLWLIAADLIGCDRAVMFKVTFVSACALLFAELMDPRLWFSHDTGEPKLSGPLCQTCGSQEMKPFSRQRRRLLSERMRRLPGVTVYNRPGASFNPCRGTRAKPPPCSRCPLTNQAASWVRARWCERRQWCIGAAAAVAAAAACRTPPFI